MSARNYLTPEEQQQMDEYMTRMFGYKLGEQKCKHQVAPNCVKIDMAYEFRPGTNMCLNCYSHKEKVRRAKNKAKSKSK